MGLRLSVRTRAWQAGVDATAAGLPDVVPVVKGNGYGFGRPALMPVAAELSPTIAVGTVYEARDVPADRTALVLTPHVDVLPRDLPRSVVLTVGSPAHVDALQQQGWTGNVAVKLRSSMRRYGTLPADLGDLVERAERAGLQPTRYSLHLPLGGGPQQRIGEVEAWLPHLSNHLPLEISHVDAAGWAGLRAAHPHRAWGIRAGTALWHADKAQLHLTADVVDVSPVRAGDTAGYRAATVAVHGTLVSIAAGSAHGVQPLRDGRSPFHFARRRLTLVEDPHMHTSMVVVPRGDDCPHVGQRVDVQRPLTTTNVDELEWLA